MRRCDCWTCEPPARRPWFRRSPPHRYVMQRAYEWTPPVVPPPVTREEYLLIAEIWRRSLDSVRPSLV